MNRTLTTAILVAFAGLSTPALADDKKYPATHRVSPR
jgi:hypothetical protein